MNAQKLISLAGLLVAHICFASHPQPAVLPCEDSAAVRLAEKFLRDETKVLGCVRKINDCFLIVNVDGRMRPSTAANSSLDIMYAFFEEHSAFFGLKEPRAQLRFANTPVDSNVVDNDFGQKWVRYILCQYHEGIKVSESHIEVHVWPDAGVISEIHLKIIPNIDMDGNPSVTAEQAIDIVASQLKHSCQSKPPTLLYQSFDQSVHLIWMVGIVCGAHMASHGEVALVDACTGEILDWRKTWTS